MTNVKFLHTGHYEARGPVSGNLYIFDERIPIQAIDDRDVPGLITKLRINGGCCGHRTTAALFEVTV